MGCLWTWRFYLAILGIHKSNIQVEWHSQDSLLHIKKWCMVIPDHYAEGSFSCCHLPPSWFRRAPFDDPRQWAEIDDIRTQQKFCMSDVVYTVALLNNNCHSTSIFPVISSLAQRGHNLSTCWLHRSAACLEAGIQSVKPRMRNISALTCLDCVINWVVNVEPGHGLPRSEQRHAGQVAWSNPS